MKKYNLLILGLFITSCGKQTAPPMDIQNTEKTTTENQVERMDIPEATFAATPVLNDEINQGPKPEPTPEPNLDIKNELKIEPILYKDFAWEKNLVEPGDFLIKIAKREYGDFRLWRHIYAWNKDEIGENPNMIYPYNFLNLQRERLKAKTAEPTYTNYTVQNGDNLWNIAGNQYGDAKSWIILLRDNQELIKANAGILNPGMTLKLRTKLDPNA
jgi:nucleoid-associated protein YgaU